MEYFCRCLVVLSIFCALGNQKLYAQTSFFRYVAIGDSYSGGIGVAAHEAWPVVLTNHLHEDDVDITLTNLGYGGWTSEDILIKQVPEVVALKIGRAHV